RRRDQRAGPVAHGGQRRAVPAAAHRRHLDRGRAARERRCRVVEALDAVVLLVADVHTAATVDGDAVGVVELPGPAALGAVAAVAPPHADEAAVEAELADAVVVDLGDVDAAGGLVDRGRVGQAELARRLAEAAEGANQLPVGRELLHAVVELLDHVDVAGRVGDHAAGLVELAGPAARGA